MEDSQSVTERMNALVRQWDAAGDRRAVFLECYRMMTHNMLAALDAGEFHDTAWVTQFLDRFAEYYFNALDTYEQHSPTTPAIWQLAHDTARKPGVTALQLLVLGVDAHVNYDLVLTLAELLDREWSECAEDLRRQRYVDYCHVNDVIARTVDAVQDQVIEPREPALRVADVMLGPVDEWATSRLIRHWRDKVWERLVLLLETPDPGRREEQRRQMEAAALTRAHAILLQEGLESIAHIW